MDIQIKSRVKCIDRPVGEVSRLILSQTTREITDMVVRLDADGREIVVPVDGNTSVRPGPEVVLLYPVDRLEGMPGFRRGDWEEVEVAEFAPHLHVHQGEVLAKFPAAERDLSRRRFFFWASNAIGALITLPLVWPVFKYLIFPLYKGFDNAWVRLGKADRLPIADSPVLLDFTRTPKEAYMVNTVKKTAWGVKASPDLLKEVYKGDPERVFKEVDGKPIWENKGVEYIVYSGKCPHLGCAYRWDEAEKRFICPCHLSVFKLNGEVVSGPAPRRLDTLPVRLADGHVEIIDAEYKASEHGKKRIV
ncbi:MAG: hypothetical protein A2V83_10525 [Nitrospirae bacterium RBG_16_64_22]|nr:MAG: hypothetical protein A2V83_10525 [Nitrospirae bacterium RBG_16_64_22]